MSDILSQGRKEAFGSPYYFKKTVGSLQLEDILFPCGYGFVCSSTVSLFISSDKNEGNRSFRVI